MGLAEDTINPATGLPISFSPTTENQGAGLVQAVKTSPPNPPAGNYTYRVYSMYPIEQLSEGYERLASLVLSEKLARGEEIPAYTRLKLLRLSGLPEPWHTHPVTGMVFLASADELGKGGVIGDIGNAISHAANQVGGVVQKVVQAPVRIAQQIAKPIISIAAPILKTAAPIAALIPGVGTGIAAAAQAVAGGMQNLSNMDVTKLSFKNAGAAVENVAMGVVGMSREVAGMTQNMAGLTQPPPMQGGDMTAAGYSSAATQAPGVGGAGMAPAGWSLPAGPGGQTGAPGTYVADPNTAAMMQQMTEQALGQKPGKAAAPAGPNVLLLGGGAALVIGAFFFLRQKGPTPALANPRRRYRRSYRRRR